MAEPATTSTSDGAATSPGTVGILRETVPGERRVAMVPAVVGSLTRLGLSVVVETGAGDGAGFPDEAFAARGATVASRAEVLAADVLLCVRVPGTGADADPGGVDELRPGTIVIGTARPLDDPESVERVAERGVALFTLELLPRITRAQAMDVLSSQATVAGYKAVLIAADAAAEDVPAAHDRRRAR